MTRKRLAIIGGGSSGLICLKYAIDELPGWDIQCFEKSSDIVGCWGNPTPGFVSTSTRYTTQFACFQKYDASVRRSASNAGDDYPDFFNDDEYGRYLRDFADTYDLRRHIQLSTEVVNVCRMNCGDWQLTISSNSVNRTENFSAVVFCTGLVHRVRSMECEIETLRSIDSAQPIANKRIVVIGGGESGVDMAHRLALPVLNNEVFLSLRSGIRVSPRYHPIRGVPSDYLRNRLLLSFHPGIRNALGEWFVRFRIGFREILERMFPAAVELTTKQDQSAAELRRYWDLKLTHHARDKLFNVYHNKSDDFLNDVGDRRITIVGAMTDHGGKSFYEFAGTERIRVNPDLIVPSIGYQSGLESLTAGRLRLADFFVGCLHTHWDNVFASGFTRPIIGNIPSTSELQARYICGTIAGRFRRPDDLSERHAIDRARLQRCYPQLDTQNVYPIEMFPYCDRLAGMMSCQPTLGRLGSLRRWVRMMLCPATTIHYSEKYLEESSVPREPIHLPWFFTLIMLLLKPVDWIYRMIVVHRLTQRND